MSAYQKSAPVWLGVLLVAGFATVTVGQPGDLWDPLPPGYSQVRYAQWAGMVLLCEGLPETDGGSPGGAYCGPASSAILLKGLNENGYPNVGTWGESCCEVTEAIFDLGESMSCSPNGGTSTTNMRNALQDILDDAYPGQFNVGYLGRVSDVELANQLGRKFEWLTVHLNFNHRVIANIGWYDIEGVGVFLGRRCGGHYVAITGYDDVAGEYWVRFRDPIHRFIDCDISAASATCSTLDDECVERWKTSLEDTWLQDTGAGCNMEPVTASRWHWDRPGRTGKFCDVEGLGCAQRLPHQDGFVYIGATVVFTRAPAGAGAFLSYNLATGVPATHSGASGTICTTLQRHPILFQLYHCAPSDNHVYVTDLQTDDVRPLTTSAAINQPRRLVFGSDGTLYLLQSDPSGAPLVSAIDPDGNLSDQTVPPWLPDDIAYHEKLDRVYAWSGAVGQAQAYTNRLAPIGTPISLPPDTTYVGPGYLAVDPTGDILYYNHGGDSVIFRFDLSTGTQMTPISDTELGDPADMALDNRGHIYVAQRTASPVLEFDRNGDRVTTSAASGLTAHTVLTITRASRRTLLDPDETNLHNQNVDSVDEENIPTLSAWGLAVMTLLVLAAGTLLLRSRLRQARA